MAAEADLPDPQVAGLLEEIHRQYGYDLRGYAPGSMKRRLAAAIARWGLSGMEELQRRCLAEPPFFAALLESLTVQVSEMFRDPLVYRTLRAQVIPILRTYPRLAIWVCGCATGEEAYSIAILLTEEGLYERAQIYATDLSARAVEHAKEGVYRADSIATYARNYREAGGTIGLDQYYTPAYDRVAMRSSLRRNMLFLQHDLVSDYIFGEMNLILCRNVLIYFGRELQETVIEKLTKALPPGGFLCLGSSERLSRSAPVRFDDFSSEDRIYRRSLPA
jgi:chemotaxis protein methyltransferase CheR